jgi:hypothetical protein
MEYTLAFRGTAKLVNWIDNKQQEGGNSPDAKWAIKMAKAFAENCKGCDITTTGHSKAGAEASLAGVAIDAPVYTFNPAHANYSAYGLDEEASNYDFEGKMQNYIVSGEILNGFYNWSGKYSGLKGSVQYLNAPEYKFAPMLNGFGFTMNGSTRINQSSKYSTLDMHYMGTVNLSTPKK